jgi:hypothetical protein
MERLLTQEDGENVVSYRYIEPEKKSSEKELVAYSFAETGLFFLK